MIGRNSAFFSRKHSFEIFVHTFQRGGVFDAKASFFRDGFFLTLKQFAWRSPAKRENGIRRTLRGPNSRRATTRSAL